jgi:hypothetical protein
MVSLRKAVLGVLVTVGLQVSPPAQAAPIGVDSARAVGSQSGLTSQVRWVWVGRHHHRHHYRHHYRHRHYYRHQYRYHHRHHWRHGHWRRHHWHRHYWHHRPSHHHHGGYFGNYRPYRAYGGW